MGREEGNSSGSSRKKRKQETYDDDEENVEKVDKVKKEKKSSSITKEKTDKKKKHKISSTTKREEQDEQEDDNINTSSSSSSSSKVKKEVKVEDDNDDEDNDQIDNKDTSTTVSTNDKNKPCKGNPQGITRLFLGNLSFTVNESIIEDFFNIEYSAGIVTHVKWITDKQTGKFYGSAFIEMNNSIAAAAAVALTGKELLNRPIKINFAPARPNELWPPETKTITGNGTNVTKTNTSTSNNTGSDSTYGTGGGQAISIGIEGMKSPKPVGCCKLFLGNLSYEVTDELLVNFFLNSTAQVEVKAIRFIHHKDSGQFKGVGYAEFWNPEACEKAAALNGKNLLGRPIRLDWTD